MVDAGTDRLIAEGYVARREHRLDDARAHFEAAITSCREKGHTACLAQALAGLGQIERDLHHSAAARICYEEAVALYRHLANPPALAHALRHFAETLREDGEGGQAEVCYREALQLYRRGAGSSLDIANTLRGLALIENDGGDNVMALSLWREARALYAEVGVQAGVQECDSYLAGPAKV